jgi:hypothetical protein
LGFQGCIPFGQQPLPADCLLEFLLQAGSPAAHPGKFPAVLLFNGFKLFCKGVSGSFQGVYLLLLGAVQCLEFFYLLCLRGLFADILPQDIPLHPVRRPDLEIGFVVILEHLDGRAGFQAFQDFVTSAFSQPHGDYQFVDDVARIRESRDRREAECEQQQDRGNNSAAHYRSPDKGERLAGNSVTVIG